MKKGILMILLSLVFLGYENAKANGTLPVDWPKLTIKVEIGQPFSCAVAWNICKIDVGISYLAATAELLQAGESGPGSWELNIPRENFVKYYPGFLNKLDGQSTVTFGSSYTVPPNVRKALGASRDIVIQGDVSYPLKFENGVYTITFKF